MCRFLIKTTPAPEPVSQWLNGFADMARDSQVSPGKWQGDGWGCAWLDPLGQWQSYKSLAPVWQDRDAFDRLPPTRCVVAHARSASFDREKGVIEVNQPYLNGQYAYVFNGWLKGVRFTPNLSGSIGAQKLWHLLQIYLEESPPQTALDRLRTWLIAHTQHIGACNIALTNGEDIFALSMYDKRGEYYNLHTATLPNARMLVSEPICNVPTQWIPQNLAVTLISPQYQ